MQRELRTVEKGDVALAMFTARLMGGGLAVLLPVSQMSRYDMAIDRGDKIDRIQVKTGRLRNGAVVFNAYSARYHRKKKDMNYRGQVEFFGVYCPDTDCCYLVPVDHVGVGHGYLRVDTPKNNHSKMRRASDYKI